MSTIATLNDHKISKRDRSYRQTSDIYRTLEVYEIVDHSDVAWASPLGTAPTTSPFSIKHLDSMDLAKATARRDKKHLSFGSWFVLYYRYDDIATYVQNVLSAQFAQVFCYNCYCQR